MPCAEYHDVHLRWYAAASRFSRPYKKNDQPTIESRNGQLVRKYGFYYRYGTDEERVVLNRLWQLVNSTTGPGRSSTGRHHAVAFARLRRRVCKPLLRRSCVSNLEKHFFPFFGSRSMGKVTSSMVQDWVTKATADGLAPRSVFKYQTVLHSIFKRATRDGIILTNPCEHTELPKVIARKSRTLTPDEYDALLRAIPDRHRLMVETAIETGMRWGELIALRPRHIDFLRRCVTVEERGRSQPLSPASPRHRRSR